MIDLALVKWRLEQNKEYLRNCGHFSPEQWKHETLVNDKFIEDFIEDGRDWLDAAFAEIEWLEGQVTLWKTRLNEEQARLRTELGKFYECDDIECRSSSPLKVYHKEES